MKILLYTLFVFTLLARFIVDVPIVIGGGGIWTTDILIVIILIVYLLFYTKKYPITKLLFATKIRKSIGAIIILLIIPLFIGLINEHSLPTIFRDSRPIMVYIISLVFLTQFNTEKRLKKYFSFIIFLMGTSLLVFFISYFVDYQFPSVWGIDIDYETNAGVIKRYGISSALFFYPLLFFILLNIVFFSIYKDKKHLAIILFLIATAFAIYYNSMRAMILGCSLGFILNIILFGNKRQIVTILSFSFVALILVNVTPANGLLSIPQIERVISLFDPSVSTTGISNNRKFRLEAITIAIEDSQNLILGNGYGSTSLESNNALINKSKWWNHSSIAWGIYKLGIVWFGMVLFNIIRIFYYGYFLIKKIDDKYLQAVLAGLIFFLISLFGLAGGTNVFFRGDFMTIQVTICLGLILSIENIYIKK